MYSGNITDTHNWSQELKKTLYNHLDLAERGVVKLFMEIRKHYHGDDMLDFLLCVPERVFQPKSCSYVKLVPASYLASVVLAQPKDNSYITAEKDADGNLQIPAGQYLLFCFYICWYMQKKGLIKNLLEMETFLALNQRICNLFNRNKNS